MDNSSTASAPSELASLLTGDRMRLWPYLRGYLPRGILADVWKLLDAEGPQIWARVFHGQSVDRDAVPFSTRGDLVEFLAYFSSPWMPRQLLIFQDQESEEIAGCTWLEEIIWGHRACCGVWIRKKFWGASAEEIGRMTVRYAVEQLGLPVLWALTPWPEAAHFAMRCGFVRQAVLPGFSGTQVCPLDLYILAYQKGERDGEG